MTTPTPPPPPPAPAHRLATAAVHAGEPVPRVSGAVVMPIFQSANYLHADVDDYHDIRYVRLSNAPNHLALHEKLAVLEGAEAALVTASGMAAISTALLTVLAAGDHVLAIDAPYGGTRSLLTQELPRLGIGHTFVDGLDPDAWAAARRPETKAIYVETITNPLMRVPDLPAVVAFAREHGLVSMIDNTMASPVNYRPPMHGFDLSLHSATKYLAGHSDVAAGAIIGRHHLLRRAERRLAHLGGVLDPHACFLLHRGMKTLALRVRHQNATAARIAARVVKHPAVARVHYPGLPRTPGHEHARAHLEGFGGMMSIEFHDGLAAAERFLDALTIPLHAASLGGVESLVIRPAVTAYANVPRAERERLGVSDGLVRLSVGIEDPEDLLGDFDRALAAAAAPTTPS